MEIYARDVRVDVSSAPGIKRNGRASVRLLISLSCGLLTFEAVKPAHLSAWVCSNI